MKFPSIYLGHVLWVVFWGLLGMAVGAAAWSQKKTPTYKNVLASTLGIFFEALGVELARGHQALILPLVIGLILALGVRFLPEDGTKLKAFKFQGRTVISWLFILYFFVGIMVLLLAYRGWWDILLVYPG